MINTAKSWEPTFGPKQVQISYIRYKFLVLIDNEQELTPKHLHMMIKIVNFNSKETTVITAVKDMSQTSEKA